MAVEIGPESDHHDMSKDSQSLKRDHSNLDSSTSRVPLRDQPADQQCGHGDEAECAGLRRSGIVQYTRQESEQQSLPPAAPPLLGAS